MNVCRPSERRTDKLLFLRPGEVLCVVVSCECVCLCRVDQKI